MTVLCTYPSRIAALPLLVVKHRPGSARVLAAGEGRKGRLRRRWVGRRSGRVGGLFLDPVLPRDTDSSQVVEVVARADAHALVRAVVVGARHRVRRGAQAGVDHAAQNGALVEGRDSAAEGGGARLQPGGRPVLGVGDRRRRRQHKGRGWRRVAAEAVRHFGMFAPPRVVQLQPLGQIVQKEAKNSTRLRGQGRV